MKKNRITKAILLLITAILTLPTIAQQSGTYTLNPSDIGRSLIINVPANVPIKFSCSFDNPYISFSISSNNDSFNSEDWPGVRNFTMTSSDGVIEIYCEAFQGRIFTLNWEVHSVEKSLYVAGDSKITGDLSVGLSTNNFTNARLKVLGNSNTYGIYSSTNNYSGPVYGIYSSTNNYSGPVYGIYSQVSSSTGQKWSGYFTGGDVAIMDGRLGVGTYAPNGQFEVVGRPGRGGLIVTAENLDIALGDKTSILRNSSKMLHGWNYSRGEGEQDFFGNRGGGSMGGFRFYDIDNTGNITNLLTLKGNGHVGIGTSNPQNALDVKGTIRATEVKVESVDRFADFVFAPGYQLPTLEAVEQHIKEKGHLAEIPSAQEVKENGMSLVDMQVKLLQKIEEMTLYIIQQEKRIKQLEGSQKSRNKKN